LINPAKDKDRPTSRVFVVVLALITSMGPLSLHLFFPAIPAVKSEFGIDDSLAQLTTSGPLLTMAFLSLVYGSLSDRYGRRPVLLGSVVLFICGCAVAATAENIWMLIVGRLIQAAGGACGLSLARTIARDVFGTDGLVKVIAYLLMAYSMMPLIAPPIGGFLVDGFGWRSVLIFASGAGAIIGLLSYFILYETRPASDPTHRQRSVTAGYLELLRDMRFTALVLQSGLCSGAFFTMATGASLLMKDYLNRPASEYGLYFMLFPIGYWLGNLTSSKLSGRVAIETMVLAGSTLLVLTAIGMAVIVLAGYVVPLSIFIPGFLVTFAQGIALPNTQAGAIRLAGPLAGTASGIGVFCQLFGAAVFTQFYGLIADGTPTPFMIVILLASGLSFVAGTIPFIIARCGRPLTG
jgi:MFS transporter, DHA1 family, multidrug resistance protein